MTDFQFDSKPMPGDELEEGRDGCPGTRQGSGAADEGRPLGRRLLALALGVVLAIGLGASFFAWRGRPTPEAESVVTVAGSLEAFDALLAARAADGPTPLPPGPGPHLVREPISEAVALQIIPALGGSSSGVEYDPYTYFRARPRIEKRVPFTQRPEGFWTFRTNSDGLRQDKEISRERPDLRILAIGDSHTEGVCFNHESWPQRLEQALHDRRPGQRFEVINTGKGGYHFYNYLGVLEKYLPLAPDVVVIGMYSGNDFAESLTYHHYFRRTTRSSCEDCDRDVSRSRRHQLPLGYHMQALRQARTFRHHPEEVGAARESALSVIAECIRICRERGIHLVLLHIPPMVVAQPEFLGEELDEALLAAGLSREDLELAMRLADETLALAAQLGASVVDPLPRFRNVERQLYWDGDHHLSVDGNRAVAALLAPAIEDLLLGRQLRSWR